MHPIIYDVSVSLDGFICGPDGDVTLFDHEGAVVEDYMARMAGYDTAIMGRATYEFGYAFGLPPGANPYPHMKTHVFSGSMELPEAREVALEPRITRARLDALRREAGGPIYLCGGGVFAGALLGMGAIDLIRLKRAPIVLGGGVPLFAGGVQPARLECIETRAYDNGYVFQEFRVAS